MDFDLEAPVINFTDDYKYTRKTQWNLFPNSSKKKSIKNDYYYEIVIVIY